jgi:PPM family protein phosphatase
MPSDFYTPRPGIAAAALTDVGLQRANNEDSHLLWEPASDDDFVRKGRLAIVADGMGGYEGGEKASRLAVETIRQIYESDSSSDPQQTLVDAFITAHAAIQRYAVDHPDLQGMGTTGTAIALLGRQLYFAHVGDSRLYLIRDNSISRLTRDDSYVGRLVENGIVRAEDAESHPRRHILTAALGSGRDIMPSVPEHTIVLAENDTLLLCTDGLWSLVPEADILHISQSYPPTEACSQLVQAALDRGAPDNVTVLILRISDPLKT